MINIVQFIMNIVVTIFLSVVVGRTLLCGIIANNSMSFARQKMDENNRISPKAIDKLNLNIKNTKHRIFTLNLWIAFTTVIWSSGYILYCGIKKQFNIENEILDCFSQTSLLMVASFGVFLLWRYLKSTEQYIPTNNEQSIISFISLISASLMAVTSGMSNYTVAIVFIVGLIFDINPEAWNIKKKYQELLDSSSDTICRATLIFYLLNISITTIALSTIAVISKINFIKNCPHLSFLTNLTFMSASCVLLTIELIIYFMFEKKICNMLFNLKVTWDS